MKIPKLILLLILIFFSISCKKPRADSIDVTIRFKIVNSQGQDLLNSPLIYDRNNIVVSNIINGQVQAPTGAGFTLGKDENGLNVLSIFPNITFKETTTTTLMQLGTSKADTIKCEYLINSNSIYCSKVWVNNTLKFTDVARTYAVSRVVTIVK